MNTMRKQQMKYRGFSNIYFIIILTSIFLLLTSMLNNFSQKTRFGFENEAQKAIEKKNNLNDSYLLVKDENGTIKSSPNLITVIANKGSKDATNIQAFISKFNSENLKKVLVQRTSLPPDQNTSIDAGKVNAGDKIIITSKQGIYIYEVTT